MSDDEQLGKLIGEARGDNVVTESREELWRAAISVFLVGFSAGRRREKGALRAMAHADSRHIFGEFEEALNWFEIKMAVAAATRALNAADISEGAVRALIDELEVERRQGWAAFFRLRDEQPAT